MATPKPRGDRVRVKVRISRPLAAKVARRVERGGFMSVGEYVRHAVRAELASARRREFDPALDAAGATRRVAKRVRGAGSAARAKRGDDRRR
jgi:Arc/MetJ-type ribon-helix-helix transcriptional regulator